jgi:hypothetical protein
MRRISSQATFFYKRIYPVVYWGFVAAFTVIPLIGGMVTGQHTPLLWYMVPLAMALTGYTLLKDAFYLADEVVDTGDALIVRIGEQEDRILLSDITDVSCSVGRATRVTLSLRKPGIFGDKVSFYAAQGIPFIRASEADQLTEKVRARRSA